MSWNDLKDCLKYLYIKLLHLPCRQKSLSELSCLTCVKNSFPLEAELIGEIAMSFSLGEAEYLYSYTRALNIRDA